MVPALWRTMPKTVESPSPVPFPGSLGGDHRQVHVLADQTPEHLFHGTHDLVEIHHARLQNLLPAEREQLLGEGRRALACSLDLEQIFAHRIAGFELRREQSAIAENDGE